MNGVGFYYVRAVQELTLGVGYYTILVFVPIDVGSDHWNILDIALFMVLEVVVRHEIGY